MVDARGTSITSFYGEPKRIVSLVPSQTELLFDLGLDNAVVGVTKFCVHPADRVKTKRRIGGTKNLNLEAIKELKPDLILANKEENVQEQIETLARLFPVWVTDVSNVPDALVMIETIGTLTNCRRAAAAINEQINAGFDELQKLPCQSPLRVCYLIWKDPYLTVGGDTFIHDMIQRAGFENSFGSTTRYPEVTIAQLQTAGCDALLLSSEPYPFAGKHIAFFQELLPQTKIRLVDGEVFSWYGSRMQRAPGYFAWLQAAIVAGT